MMQWLATAIGFEQICAYDNPDGSLSHAEMALGSSAIMIGQAGSEGFARFVKTPRSIGASTQALYVAVSDTDALHERAVEAGAEIIQPLTDQPYGSRDFSMRDPEGYIWCFGTYRPGDFEKG